MSISIKNYNHSTSPFWGKIQVASIYVSSTIMGSALSTDNHPLAWVSFALTILAGLIPIFTNGPPPKPTVDATVHP